MRPGLLDRLLALILLAGTLFGAYWIADRYYLKRIEARHEQGLVLQEERTLLAGRRYAQGDIDALISSREGLRDVVLQLEQVENQRLALADAEAWVRERMGTTEASLLRLESKAEPLAEDEGIVLVTLTAQFECPESGLAEMISRLEFEGRTLKPLKSLTLRRENALRRDDQDPLRLLRGRFEAVRLYAVDPVAK